MKYLDKTNKYVIIELNKGEKFDWIYFATTGLDIGKTQKHGFEEVEHHIPMKKDKIKIKIEILDSTEKR